MVSRWRDSEAVHQFPTEVSGSENTTPSYSDDQEIQNSAPRFTQVTGNQHGQDKHSGTGKRKC